MTTTSSVLALTIVLVASPAVAGKGDKKPKARTTESRGSSDSGSPKRTSEPTSNDVDTSADEGEGRKEGGKSGGDKVRVYEFSGLDVEGKLKAPQLLYFLNRVKLELEPSAPDKRSFMKDLERSADDKSL